MATNNAVSFNQLKKSVSNMKNYTDSKTKILPEKYDAYILNNAVPESSATAEQYGEQMTLYKISDSNIVFPENSILTDKDLEYKVYAICKLSETQKCIITYNDGTKDITKNIELEHGRYDSDDDGLQISLEERYEDANGKTQAGLFVVVAAPDISSSPQSDERVQDAAYKYFEVKKISLYIDWYKNQLPDRSISDLNFDKITNLPYDIENLKNNEGEILTKEEKVLLKKNLSLWGSENIDDYNKAPYTTSAQNNIFSSGNTIGITVKAKKPALGKGLKIEPFYFDRSYALYYRKSPNVVIDIINSKGTIIDSLDGNEEANILQFYNLREYTFDKNNDCYFVFSLKADAPTDRTHGVEQFHLIEVGDPILTYADVDKKVDKVDGMSLTHNDLTNELKANYDAAYAHSQAKHSYNDLTDKPVIPDASSFAPITSPVFKKSISIGNVATDKTLGENSIIASSYGEASGAYTLSNGKAAAARADYSHAEGYASMSKGIYSHAEGEQTGAIGQSSHSEGNGSSAKGIASHAEGYYTTSNGKYSHAEGYNTIATGDNQHVQGKYNIEDKANKYAHIVGNGYRDELNYTDHRSNGYTLDWSGNGWFAGKVTQEGTPTEDKDLTTKKYVDDTVVFKKLSSIIELNSGKKIINVEKFEDNKVYYFINDINTSTTTLVPISLYKNNEKVNTMVIYPNDRFITMGYKSSTNEFFSFSDMESVKYNVVNKTREYNNSRSVTKKADSDQVLTKTNTTAFTPTADYQPATKKYVDDGNLEATSDEVKAMLAKVLGGDYSGEKN